MVDERSILNKASKETLIELIIVLNTCFTECASNITKIAHLLNTDTKIENICERIKELLEEAR